MTMAEDMANQIMSAALQDAGESLAKKGKEIEDNNEIPDDANSSGENSSFSKKMKKIIDKDGNGIFDWNDVLLWIKAGLVCFMIGLSLTLYYGSEEIGNIISEGDSGNKSVVIVSVIFAWKMARIRENKSTNQLKYELEETKKQLKEAIEFSDKEGEKFRYIIEVYDRELFLRDLQIIGSKVATTAKDDIVRKIFERFPDIKEYFEGKSLLPNVESKEI